MHWDLNPQLPDLRLLARAGFSISPRDHFAHIGSQHSGCLRAVPKATTAVTSSITQSLYTHQSSRPSEEATFQDHSMPDEATYVEETSTVTTASETPAMMCKGKKVKLKKFFCGAVA